MRHHRAVVPRRERRHRLFTALALLALSACQRPDLRPAEALAASDGHADEAIAAYEAVCDAFPGHDDCATAQRRLAGLHARAADEQMSRGQFIAADQRLLLALAVASTAERPDLELRRQSPRLQAGLRVERACRFAPPDLAFATLSELAQEGSPVAEHARPCLDRERRRLLLARVERACSAAPEESCVGLLPLVSQLSPPDEPSIRSALALITQEQKRLEPLLRRVEARLKALAALAHQQRSVHDRIERCIEDLNNDSEPHGRPIEIRLQCDGRFGGEPDTTLVNEQQTVVEEAITEVVDPALQATLRARLADAVLGTYRPSTPPATPARKP